MYLKYWKNIFNYKGTSKLSHLGLNILINIVILFCISFIGFFVPPSWENTFVDIYYYVLFIMILPTISMFVRVLRSFNEKH